MLNTIWNWLRLDFGGGARTLLSTKMETFKYRPGRLDMCLLFDPARQGEFEKECNEAGKTRGQAFAVEDASYVKQMADVQQAHDLKARTINRDYDRTMRLLVAKYGAISPDEPVVLVKRTQRATLGPAAEA